MNLRRFLQSHIDHIRTGSRRFEMLAADWIHVRWGTIYGALGAGATYAATLAQAHFIPWLHTLGPWGMVGGMLAGFAAAFAIQYCQGGKGEFKTLTDPNQYLQPGAKPSSGPVSFNPPK